MPDNYPLGAMYDSAAPYNQRYDDTDELCQIGIDRYGFEYNDETDLYTRNGFEYDCYDVANQVSQWLADYSD